MSDFDLANIDNALAAWWGDEGLPVDAGGWIFHVKPVSDRNPEWVRWFAAHSEAANDKTQMPLHIVDVLVGCLVVNWTGARDRHGTEIPYSPDTARELFSLHPALANEVFFKAQELGNRVDESVSEGDDAVGKSQGGTDATQAA